MKEDSTVKQNMMDNVDYRPYCGNSNDSGCSMPRTLRRGDMQFICPECKWVSSLPPEFIERYTQKHNLKQNG